MRKGGVTEGAWESVTWTGTSLGFPAQPPLLVARGQAPVEKMALQLLCILSPLRHCHHMLQAVAFELELAGGTCWKQLK